MKKVLSNKRFLLVLLLMATLFVLSGCQRNTDAQGNTLAEKIIYLDTPWRQMKEESILTAILVYPLAQCINFIGTKLNSAIIGILLTTVLFNLLTVGISKKSTISAQKMQIIQPEIQKITDKYADKKDPESQRRQAAEMQAVYSKHGVDPLGSIVTPFLQIPIMISMYYAVQRAAVVVAGKIGSIPLSTTPKDAFKSIKTGWPIVILFIAMLGAQLLSSFIPQILAKRQKKNQKGYKKYADNDTSNNAANSTMLVTIAMVALLGVGWPSTMSVYWLVSSVCNILKTLYIQWRYIDNEKV